MALQSHYEIGVALARSAQHRAALEAMLAEAAGGTKPEKGPKEAERYLAQLRKEVGLNKRREADLLGALNVTREERAWMEEIARTLEEDEIDSDALEALESGLDPAAVSAGPPAVAPERRERGGDDAEPTAIEVRGVSKAFQIPLHRPETLKERLLHPLRDTGEHLQALDAVSFDVGAGEFLGIAGPNGSGKSTLLKILAGIYATDEGTVTMAGRVAPFIELGVGMNGELTAYDNVVISAVMMGLEPNEARARYEEVVAFAGLEEFTELKLKNYSSGMQVRLAFAVMSQVDADILLIDEVLAVGDAEFREKCLVRLQELRSVGKTIVLVSHDMEAMVQDCDRAILLDQGQIAAEGEPAEIAERYGAVTETPEPRRKHVSRLPAARRRRKPPEVGNGPGVAVTVAAALVAAILVSSLAGADLTRELAAFLGLSVVAVALRGRALAIGVVALGAAWAIAALTIEGMPHVINPAPPVTEAIGGASYFGTPYQGAQLAALTAMALVVAAGIAGAIRLGKIARSGTRPDGEAEEETERAPNRSRKRDSRIVALGAILISLSLVPDLRASVDETLQPVVTSWDTANFVVWDSLVNQGLTPMKDFWYPHGLQWVFALFPEGAVFFWLSHAGVFGLIAWALWRLSGRDATRVILCLLALAILSFGDPYLWRYYVALTIPITYAALGPARHRRLTRGHAVFAGACLLGAFMEPDLLLFGAVASALVLVGEICSGRTSWNVRPLARGLLVDSLPVLVAIAALVLTWFATGIADGSARFFLGLDTTSSFVAPDQTTDGGMRFFSIVPSLDALRVLLPSLLATAGLLHALFGRGRARVAPVLLAASGVSLLMLFKYMIRPADLVLPIAFLALVWSAILLWRPRALVACAVTGAFLGAAFVGVENQQKGVSGYIKEAISSPADGVNSIALAFDSEAVRKASERRFDLRRFVGSSDLAAANEYLQATRGRPKPSFAVLGDAQLMYPIFRQRPPYHSELYDASPIYEQRAMVESLAREKPAMLVWRRDFSRDRVPYHVRDPVVFSYAIDHYTPVRRGWTTDVLRRRRSGEPIAATYWRQRLGATVDLGFVPSLSEADDAAQCAGGEGCSEYVLAEGEASETGRTISVGVEGRGRTFEVRFRTLEGVGTYPLRLDRLWFWPLVGARPTIFSRTPGWSVRQVKLRSGDNLY